MRALQWVLWPGRSSWILEHERRCSRAQDSCQVCASLSGWWHTYHSELLRAKKKKRCFYHNRTAIAIKKKWHKTWRGADVTLLKLHLYLQVALQQIKNHRFHVATDSTPISEQKKFRFVNNYNSNIIQRYYCYYHHYTICIWPNGKKKKKKTSAPAVQCSECSWRKPLGQLSSARLLHGCLKCLQSGIR